MAVGFVGVGKMGSGMARNLLKAGYELFVCDANKNAAAELVREGAQMVASPLELASNPGDCAMLIYLHVRMHFYIFIIYIHIGFIQESARSSVCCPAQLMLRRPISERKGYYRIN
jgi:hypothetical protein